MNPAGQPAPSTPLNLQPSEIAFYAAGGLVFAGLAAIAGKALGEAGKILMAPSRENPYVSPHYRSGTTVHPGHGSSPYHRKGGHVKGHWAK